MATERPRFSITVSEEMYNQINQYQHENRFKTQTKAIAEILRIGLDSLTKDIGDTDKSTELEKEMSIQQYLSINYGPEVFQAFNLFIQLDMLDRGRIIGNMENMLDNEKYSNQKKVKHA